MKEKTILFGVLFSCGLLFFWGISGERENTELPVSAPQYNLSPVAEECMSELVFIRRAAGLQNPFGKCVPRTTIAAPTVTVATDTIPVTEIMSPRLKGWLRTEKESLAILDTATGGKTVGMGESVDGWTVVKIENNEVHLRGNAGETVLRLTEE